MKKRIAVVTGANRGLGWGTAQALAHKEFDLVLAGRKRADLEKRAEELRAHGAKVEVLELDLGQPDSIEKAAALLKEMHPEGIDLLVNNAGVFLENDKPYDPKTVASTMQTNALGPLEFSLSLASLLTKKKGVVVNVSSGMGQLSEMSGGSPGYRISKTALNAVTRYLAAEWKDTGVRVNSICPGWVKTDMGGASAPRSLEEGVKSILFAATIPADGPTGGFFRDGKSIDW